MRENRSANAGRNGHDAVQHAASGSTSAAEDTVDFDAEGTNDQQQTPEGDAFQLLLRQFGELREYFSYYLSAKADSAQLGLRNALISMTLAALAFVVVAGLGVAATWFVLIGTAEGLGILFGNRPWAGNLVTGLLLAIGLGFGMCRVVFSFKKTARERTAAKYENRQFRQQFRYGHNVAGRAAAQGSKQK